MLERTATLKRDKGGTTARLAQAGHLSRVVSCVVYTTIRPLLCRLLPKWSASLPSVSCLQPPQFLARCWALSGSSHMATSDQRAVPPAPLPTLTWY